MLLNGVLTPCVEDGCVWHPHLGMTGVFQFVGLVTSVAKCLVAAVAFEMNRLDGGKGEGVCRTPYS